MKQKCPYCGKMVDPRRVSRHHEAHAREMAPQAVQQPACNVVGAIRKIMVVAREVGGLGKLKDLVEVMS